MDVNHEILNVVFPIVSIILLVFLVPILWLCNLVRVCFKIAYPEELARKVILITGASTGIGEQLAIEYAKEGACLALVARREKQLQMVAKNAEAMGSPDVIMIPADVSKFEDCNTIVDQTIEHFGKIDYLVNNAAVGKFGLFEDLNCLPDHNYVMDVNFWGSVYITQFALPYLKKNKGKIIAICSCGGWFATPRVGVYNASKAALLSFYETLRIEVGSDIGISVVTPGMVETSLTDKDWLEEGNALWIPQISAQRCAKAIVNSTKRGDKYFTEPYWMKVILLWKTFCPEILDSIMNFVFIIWPKISGKEKKSSTTRCDQLQYK